MQRRHSSFPSGRFWPLMLAVALLVLFFAAVGASCSAYPHLYSGQGYLLFVPAGAAAQSPILAPF